MHKKPEAPGAMPVGEANPDLLTDASSKQKGKATALPKTRVVNQLVATPIRANPRQWSALNE